MSQIQLQNKDIKIWFSILRIFATIWIFIFHYLVMMGIKPSYFSSFYAISGFCFLSGYFAVTNSPNNWIIRRYFRIMLPYWIVMVAIMAINYLMPYKKVTFIDGLISLMGGSLFLNDPLYIISWFITLILILYLSVYLFSITPVPVNFMVLLGTLYFLSSIKHAALYMIIFYTGFFLSKFEFKNKRPKPVRFRSEKLNKILYSTQKFSYCFFLVHAAVLHLFMRTLRDGKIHIFVFSFLLSILSALILYELDQVIRSKISTCIANRMNGMLL